MGQLRHWPIELGSVSRGHTLAVWGLVLALVPLTGCGVLSAFNAAALPTVPEAPTPPQTIEGAETAVTVNAGDPCCPPATIWQRLGLPQFLQALRLIGNQIINRNGNFPGLEPTSQPLKPLADESNLDSPNPSVKAAAEAKQAEDGGAQQVKALKYLGTVGCGCDPAIKPAILSALDDCLEDVRYGAAKALKEAANLPCPKCNYKSCCDRDVMDKLAEVAYGKDEYGCYLEPSARVRSAARQAFKACQHNCLKCEEEDLLLPPVEEGVPEEAVVRRSFGTPLGGIVHLPSIDFTDPDQLAARGRRRLAIRAARQQQLEQQRRAEIRAALDAQARLDEHPIGPPEAYPPGAHPPAAQPHTTYPAGGYPPGGYPAGGYPAGGYPASGYPPGAQPPAAYSEHRSPQQRPPAPGAWQVPPGSGGTVPSQYQQPAPTNVAVSTPPAGGWHRGVITHLDVTNTLTVLRFELPERSPHPGVVVDVYRREGIHWQRLGKLEVVDQQGHEALAVPQAPLRLEHLRPGDEVGYRGSILARPVSTIRGSSASLPQNSTNVPRTTGSRNSTGARGCRCR